MVSSQEAGPWRSHRFPLQITVSETQATDSKPLLAPLLNQASISLHETVHLAVRVRTPSGSVARMR